MRAVDWISVAISVMGLVVTMASTLAVVSYKLGQSRQELDQVHKQMAGKADAADLTSIREALAEIKGMFVLRLRE